MARKRGRYQTGHNATEFDRQEHICFVEGLTLQMVKDAVATMMQVIVEAVGKDYTFFVHPEMLEEVNKMLDIEAGVWDNGVYENTEKAVSDKGASGDIDYPDTVTGADVI